MTDSQQRAAAKAFAQKWQGRGYEKGESGGSHRYSICRCNRSCRSGGKNRGKAREAGLYRESHAAAQAA